MIVDHLENSGVYRAMGQEIAMALDYLRGTDFSTAPAGRYELDGDRVYAIVQRYCPKPIAEAQWEAHRRYLDVQYMAQGVERIGFALLQEDSPVAEAYNAEMDVVFYRGSGELLTLRAGEFAIFAPQDIHAPCLAADDSGMSAEVCKVVVKCRRPE